MSGKENRMIKEINTPRETQGVMEYAIAEFQLEQSPVFYQFKVRKNAVEPMFAVVKEGSTALKSLKEGNTIHITYYSQDRSIPGEQKDTRIRYIRNVHPTGFKGHHMIALDIDCRTQDLHVA